MDNKLHKGHRERVKDIYMKTGLENFHDHEVLELLLFYAIPMKDTNALSHKILNEFGSLEHLFEASPVEIMEKCNVTRNVAILLSLTPELYGRYMRVKQQNNLILDTSGKVGKYAISLYINKKYESFYVICLNNKRKLNHTALISEGTISEAAVYIRNIVEAAITYKATSIILVHNHPSGVLKPSRNDIDSTKKIINALSTINVEVIDHIIVSGHNYLSFVEKRVMNFRPSLN